MKIVKKSLTALAGLTVAGLVLTGCGKKAGQHHSSHRPKVTAVKKTHREKPTSHVKKRSFNKKDVDKSGLSTDDIKKDSRAVNQKKSTQPVD